MVVDIRTPSAIKKATNIVLSSLVLSLGITVTYLEGRQATEANPLFSTSLLQLKSSAPLCVGAPHSPLFSPPRPSEVFFPLQKLPSCRARPTPAESANYPLSVNGFAKSLKAGRH
jgi:hypothetical protein